MRKDTVTVEIIRSGQPRPYADTVCEAIISSRCDGTLMNGHFFWHHIGEARIKEMAQVLLNTTFKAKPEWFESRLESLVPLEPTAEMLAEFDAQGMKKPAADSWRPKTGCRWRIVIVTPAASSPRPRSRT